VLQREDTTENTLERNENMSAAIEVAPKIDPTKALANVINQINRLEQSEHIVISMLSLLSDDELMETRNSARLVYCCAWKIEIACDAEIWDRTKTNLTKSGVKDVDEKGVMAAVNKRSQELGCGASTIRANRHLYLTFEPLLSTQQRSLDDKGFYQAALKADDPIAKIEEWTQRKLDNPHFRPADAWREVNAEKEPDASPDPRPSEIAVLHDPDVRAWLEGDLAEEQTKEPMVPTCAPWLRNMIHARIGQIEWQLDRTVEGDCRIIKQAVSETLGTDDEVFMWLQERSYFMSDPELEDRLTMLVESGQIRLKQAEGRKKGQRGKMVDVYLPVYGLNGDDEDD
jgi:hypothetical protein